MFPAVRAWARHPSPPLVDAGLALLLGVPVVAAASHAPARWGVIFGVLVAAPVAFRRRSPLIALAVIVGAAMASPVSLPFQLGLVVVLYTIGSRRGWEQTIAAVAGVVVAGAVFLAVGGPDFDRSGLLSLALLCAVAAGFGLYIGTKRTGIDALRERAERLDRERELLAERAVVEERLRIAQELHDVVAHNVSLIVVQAQALGATAGDAAVRDATDGIAGLGRATMAEMHRTLRLLRDRGDAGEGTAPFAPQPGLGDLGDLVARSRAAGLDVEVAVAGRPYALPQSVDLSAFRIVQEALTNVIKHAGRARTRVTVEYGARSLELTIVDDGAGAGSQAPAPGGHGLVGMRERTALYGGTLSAGPRPDRGFEVRASLPLREAGA